MGEVAQEGRTVLFVSHNIGAVQRLCSRSILLVSGKIASQGETTRIIEHYLSQSKHVLEDEDLEKRPRERDLGTRARIVHCNIYDSRGKPQSSFAFGEPFTVEITCRAFRPIEDVSFLVGIDSIYEERIVTITSLEAGKTFSAKPGQVIVGRLRVDKLLLKPGIYSITLGLFSTNMGIDRVPNAARIEIDDISFSSEHPHISQVTVGVIQMPNPHWEVHRCD